MSRTSGFVASTKNTGPSPQFAARLGVAARIGEMSVCQLRPNPSVERTATGGQRLLARSALAAPVAAAHLKR